MVMLNPHHPCPSLPSPIVLESARISPALRDWVLGRDGYQCRAPGCDRSDSLDVHLVDPGKPGGHTDPANLVTICAGCRPIWDLMGRGPFEAVCDRMGRENIETSA